jgi:hypothetical protein
MPTEQKAVMGIKERAFGPLPPVSLGDLVPPDHVSRHPERTLDLGFVRGLVRQAYAGIGRPSIDPVVFFQWPLIMFFGGLRSERRLVRVVADRLGPRWYPGDGLTEPLPAPAPFQQAGPTTASRRTFFYGLGRSGDCKRLPCRAGRFLGVE